MFEKAREIVIGIEQNITYNEWLPVYTGAMSNGYHFDQGSGSGHRYIRDTSGMGGIADSVKYDRKYRASVRQQFATGTFRQHTGVSQFMHLLAQSSDLELDQSYFESCVWFGGGGPGCDAVTPDDDSDIPQVSVVSLCDILGGGEYARMRKGDTVMITGERNQLFYKKNQAGQAVGGDETGAGGWEGNGGDLAVANLFRGRDHNIASWYDFVKEFFGTTTAFPGSLCASTTGCEPASVMTNSNNLQPYQNVQHIDVWVGALAERKLSNQGMSGAFPSSLGSTLTRDVVTQFADLKAGDRWFQQTILPGFGLYKVFAETMDMHCEGTPFHKAEFCECIPKADFAIPSSPTSPEFYKNDQCGDSS